MIRRSVHKLVAAGLPTKWETYAARRGSRVARAGAGEPTGDAADEVLHRDAGDRGYTVAMALHLLQRGELRLDRALRDRGRLSHIFTSRPRYAGVPLHQAVAVYTVIAYMGTVAGVCIHAAARARYPKP